jgi:hypothetical protein
VSAGRPIHDVLDYDFHLGMEVAMLDIQTEELCELSRIAYIDHQAGWACVEGYTARFSLQGGGGLPLVENAFQTACTVVDMTGRVLHESSRQSTEIRHLAPRFSIRPAIKADRGMLAERDEASALARSLARKLSAMARKHRTPSLQIMKRVRDLLASPSSL